MIDISPSLIPILVAIISTIGLHLVAQWTARRKNKVDETVTFAAEWRKLYDEMESRVKEMEVRLQETEEVKRQKLVLEGRVSELERKVKDLSDALEYLIREVGPTHPIAAREARKIASGTPKPTKHTPE